MNGHKPCEELYLSFRPFWFLSLPELKTKIMSWIIKIHQSPLCVQNLDADIGYSGRCVQAPLARRFAPNFCCPCLHLEACSQANEATAVYIFRILSCVPLCNHDAPVALRLKFRVTSLNINCRRGRENINCRRPLWNLRITPPTTVNI